MMRQDQAKGLILAIPKGRIMPKALELLATAGIEVNTTQIAARRLVVDTSIEGLQVSIVRNSDLLLCVRSGSCDLAIVGEDQLLEDGGNDVYDLLDLAIARCWLKVAAPDKYIRKSRVVRVASKFVRLTNAYYAREGIQAQIVKLNGAMELAVQSGLADEIVDLVETGKTLADNGLVALDTILEVTSHLVANRDRLITKHQAVQQFLGLVRAAVSSCT